MYDFNLVIENLKQQRSQVQAEYDGQLNNLDHIIDSLTAITGNSIVMKLLEDTKPKEEVKPENLFLTQMPLEESIIKVFKTFRQPYSTRELADLMIMRGFKTTTKNVIQLFSQYLGRLEKKGYLAKTQNNEWILKSDHIDYLRQEKELKLKL